MSALPTAADLVGRFPTFTAVPSATVSAALDAAVGRWQRTGRWEEGGDG